METDIANVVEVSISLVSVTIGNIVSEVHDTAIVSDSSDIDVVLGNDFLGTFRSGGL